MKPGSRLLAAVGVYHFANDGALTVLPLVLPILKGLFEISYTEIGVLTAAGLAITLVVQLLVSEFAHRFSAERALAGGMVVMFISATMMLFVWNYASLLIFVVGMRIGAAAYHPLGLALVARRFNGEKIDMAMGIQSSAGDAGVFLAFITTGVIGSVFGWRSSFGLWGAICLAAAVVGIALRAGLDEPTASKALPRDPSEPGWGATAKRIGILLVPLTVGGAGYNIIVNYGPLMLSDAYGMAIWQYTLVVALWVGTGAIFTLIFGRITSRFGRGNAILASYVILAAAGLLIWFLSSVWVAALAMFLFGVSLFMTYPALFAYVTELTGGRRTEKAFGIVFTAQLSGGFIFSFLCGMVADSYGIKSPFVILSVIALVALAVTAYYLARQGKRPGP
jgi:FSR family fosmidomycin resistance protein-like MFS transporter